MSILLDLSVCNTEAEVQGSQDCGIDSFAGPSWFHQVWHKYGRLYLCRTGLPRASFSDKLGLFGEDTTANHLRD